MQHFIYYIIDTIDLVLNFRSESFREKVFLAYIPSRWKNSVTKTAAIFREAVKFKQFPASSETDEDQILSRNILDVRYVVKIYLILYTVIYRISLTTV